MNDNKHDKKCSDQEKTRSTTNDRKLQASVQLKGISSRLGDFAKELDSIHNILSPSETASVRNQKAALGTIKQTLIPFIQDASSSISSSANLMSPIGGVNYIHRRNEQKQKLECSTSSKSKISYKKSSPLKRIEQAVKKRALQTITNTAAKRPSIPRKKKKNVLPLQSVFSTIPSPNNGIHYKPKEVIDVYKSLQCKKVSRSRLASHLITNNLVPVQRTAIMRIIQDEENGKMVKQSWNMRGRTPLLNDEEIHELKCELTMYSGKTFASSDLKEKIKDAQNRRVIAQGRVPLQLPSDPSRASLCNYRALLSSVEGVSLCTSAVSKTNTRFTAENSLISAMAFLCVVASTHYDVATEIQADLEKDMKSDELPEGVKKLFKMISKAHDNLPLIPVIPALVISTDDTVNYVFEGEGTKEEKFRLVGTKSLSKAGSQSRYKYDDSKNMCGTRVKLTYSFSAAGTSAPIFITITGLNKRELTCTEDFLVLAIEGLCVGGGGVTVGNKQKGYLVFMKSEKGMDKKRYKFYRDNILLPFINDSRSTFGNWKQGDPIPPSLKAVS